MNVEQRVKLDRFKLRPYQKEIWDCIENKGYKKVLCILPRRAGKDICCWNLVIRFALRETCLVYYCLPTYKQARACIFDAITSTGERFLDYIPKELVVSINSQNMQIRLYNNSIIQCIGSDSYNTSLVGTNPKFIVFSEWSRCDPRAYEYARPILAANGGNVIFVTTPYGRNHCWYMYNTVKELKDWYVIHKTTPEINHIPEDVLWLEKEQMSPELFAQEYLCDFSRGVEGSYYARIIDDLRNKGQICKVPYEPGVPVITAWDIGVDDDTCVIFAQVYGNGTIIKIIDFYKNRDVGLDHYVKYVMDKPYKYSHHFAPADIAVREWGSGARKRIDMARDMGLSFYINENDKNINTRISREEGIEKVRMILPLCFIDEDKCKGLINALENYHREYDEERMTYKRQPIHDWSSHAADAMRVLAINLHKAKKGMTAEEFRKQRAEALYGNSNPLFGNRFGR